ncbi:MAG: hypothetical protein V4719_06940 [Planctomycetota bacterium]
MECLEFERLLEQRLDERLVPRCPELQTHAQTCVPCTFLLEDAELLSRGIAAWRGHLPAAPSDLAARITGQVLAILPPQSPVRPPELRVDRRSSPNEPPRTWQTWAVLAGSVAAVWFVFLGTTPRPDRAERVASVPTSVPESKPKTDLGAVLVSAEGAYSKLATESLAAAQDFALLWPTSSAASDAGSSPSAPGEDGSNWTPSLSRELAPIGNSVEDALDFLRRTVPRVEKSQI